MIAVPAVVRFRVAPLPMLNPVLGVLVRPLGALTLVPRVVPPHCSTALAGVTVIVAVVPVPV